MIVATFPGMIHRGYPMLGMAIAFGGALVAFALSPIYALSVALLFLLRHTRNPIQRLAMVPIWCRWIRWNRY